MKHVVITGGSRGIGFALAEEFLKRGYRVTITGTSGASVHTALSGLSREYKNIHGAVCDVRDPESVEEVWEQAQETGGTVDIWINNAGVNQPDEYLWEVSVKDAAEVVATNISGVINGCRTAIRGMLKQGSGRIYNMEGFGSDGMTRPRIVLYGTTKRAVRYLTRGLAKETTGSGVLIGALSPGMVPTDLLLGPVRKHPQTMERFKKIVNILGDTPENTALFLVDRIEKDRKNGSRIARLTRPRILFRFLTAPFTRQKLV
jgi:NAD(P)-dependent dehydrogenase (short-subunit alcohol dehydrogenase family)